MADVLESNDSPPQSTTLEVVLALHGASEIGLKKLIDLSQSNAPSVGRFEECFTTPNKTIRLYPPLNVLRDWSEMVGRVALVTPRAGPVPSRALQLNDDHRSQLFSIIDNLLLQAVAAQQLSTFGRAMGLLTILVVEQLSKTQTMSARFEVTPAVKVALGATNVGGIPPVLASHLNQLYLDANGPCETTTPAHLAWLFEAIRITQPGVVNNCDRPARDAFETFVSLREGRTVDLHGQRHAVIDYMLWKFNPPGDPDVVEVRHPLGWIQRAAVGLTGQPSVPRLIFTTLFVAIVVASIVLGLFGWHSINQFQNDSVIPLQKTLSGEKP